eukprot:8133047-Lingulodinium_polyedra.AAC.1
MMKGRQILWMILEYFKTNQSLNQKYAFMDLQTVKWSGDDKMDDFLQTYRFILSNLKAGIPDKI